MTVPAIELTNLSKTYSNNLQAVKSIDLRIEQGDFYALLGPNGAGKSTTIGMISSLVSITEGSVSILGHDLQHETSKAKQLLGVMPQEVNLNIFESAWPILLQQASYYGVPRRVAKQRAEYLLKQVDLWDKRHTTVRMLSGGMKRRLMVARALIHDPKVLMLDEPTAGVDIEIRNDIWQFLQAQNKQGLTIVLTTHYLEEAENLCNKIAIINKGKLVRQARMGDLLTELETETVVLYLKEAIDAVMLDNFTCRMLDNKTVEVDISKHQSLAELFAAIAEKGILIDRMRNKHNRLEQTFMNLVTA